VDSVDVDENGKSTYNVNIPKAEGLALHLGVNRSTLYEWAENHQAFSDILDEINALQSNRVINNALAGNYNATIAKLLLGKHGYKEQSEQDVTSGGEKITFSDEQVESIAQRIASRKGSDGNTASEE